jgi:hypothetical protein
LLLFLAATGALALIIGWARMSFGENYLFVGHYLTKALPALFCAYLAWQLYGPPPMRLGVQGGLLAVVCLLLWPNVRSGINAGQYMLAASERLERDLRAGIPLNLLAQRHGARLSGEATHRPSSNWFVTHFVTELRKAGVMVFPSIPEGPPCHAEPLTPIEPIASNELQWADGVAKGAGPQASATFALGQTRQICGIRLSYSYVLAVQPTRYYNDPASPILYLSWRGGPGSQFGEASHSAAIEMTPESLSGDLTIWIYEPVAQFRLHPNSRPDGQPVEFHLRSIELLVPDAANAASPPPATH